MKRSPVIKGAIEFQQLLKALRPYRYQIGEVSPAPLPSTGIRFLIKLKFAEIVVTSLNVKECFLTVTPCTVDIRHKLKGLLCGQVSVGMYDSLSAVVDGFLKSAVKDEQERLAELIYDLFSRLKEVGGEVMLDEVFVQQERKKKQMEETKETKEHENIVSFIIGVDGRD